MSFFPWPTATTPPAFRGSGFEFASTNAFADPSPLTPNWTTGKWVLGTLSNVDTAQLDPIATIVEKLIQQDFTDLEDDDARTVKPVGTSPAILVDATPTAAGDAPDLIKVGAQGNFAYLKAAKLADLIRSLGVRRPVGADALIET